MKRFVSDMSQPDQQDSSVQKSTSNDILSYVTQRIQWKSTSCARERKLKFNEREILI